MSHTVRGTKEAAGYADIDVEFRCGCVLGSHKLRMFLGNDPRFKEIEDYLPTQQGKALDGEKLELREYQQEALNSLEAMRLNKETIALLYHATGTGKTVTAVMDAKRCGGRVLFVAHTMELVNQVLALT